MSAMSFNPAKKRPLPVIILADASGSMDKDGKIESLNQALQDMLADLHFNQENHGQIELQLAVIAFSGTETQLVQPLQSVKNLQNLPKLSATGKTPMGKAFQRLTEMLNDPQIVPERAFYPTVILVSDGKPTDLSTDLVDKYKSNTATESDFLGWSPLASLLASKIGAKSIRLAVAIGEDVNMVFLRAFCKSDEAERPVVRAKDAKELGQYFKWATMTVSSRMASRDPNWIEFPPPNSFEDREPIF